MIDIPCSSIQDQNGDYDRNPLLSLHDQNKNGVVFLFRFVLNVY